MRSTADRRARTSRRASAVFSQADSAEGQRGDLYAEVTRRIVADLEARRAPWVQPWGRTPGAAGAVRKPVLSFAEMGSAFLCASLGIGPSVRHADYIASWLAVLRGDTRAVFRAASQASKAADWLLARHHAAREERAA